MLSPEELKIVEFGKKNGKTADDVKKAVANYRASKMKTEQAPEKQGYFSRVASQYKKEGENITAGIKKGAEDYTKGVEEGGIKGELKATGGLLRSGLRTIGGVARAAYAPISAALQPILEPVIKPVVETAMEIPGVQQLTQKATELSQKYPEASKDIKDMFDVAMLFVGQKGSKELGKGVEKTAQVTTDIAQKGADITKKGYESTKGFLKGAKDTAMPMWEEVKTIPGKAKANITQTRATEATIKSLKPAGQTAVRSGVELADVKNIYQVAKKVKATPELKKLVKVVKDFSSGKSKTNPFEVVGKPMVKGLKMAQTKASTIGNKLGKVADNLPNFSPSNLKQRVFNGLKEVQGLKGLKITPKGTLDFRNTTLATMATKSDRIAIQKIFNDAIKNSSAKSKHLLRQELFEVLGGKKAGGMAITGTQESAYEAVRKSLASALDDISPTYKDLSKQYAQAISPIKKLQKLLGTAGVDEDLLNMKAGLLARRLTSFSKSNPEIRQILRDLDKVIGANGKTGLSTETLQDFYNILDKYYDIAGQTGFQGQVTAGVSKSLEKGGMSKAVNIIENQIGKVVGETDIVKQKALEAILKELGLVI